MRAGYIERSSPVQETVTVAISTITGLDLSPVASGHDGCGIPVFALPLERLAFAMARLVDPVDLDGEAEAAIRVVEAETMLLRHLCTTRPVASSESSGHRLKPCIGNVGPPERCRR